MTLAPLSDPEFTHPHRIACDGPVYDAYNEDYVQEGGPRQEPGEDERNYEDRVMRETFYRCPNPLSST